MEVFGLGLKIQEQGAATVEASMKRLGAEIAKTVLTVGTITAGLKKLVTATSEAQAVQAQLANVLNATGYAAGQTLQQLNDHAAALQRMTAFGDEGINKVQARLLSYTNIVGDAFPRATEVVLDYAEAFNVDLVQAAEAVGKALNYPSQGMALLSKQGFILTDAQKALIKELEQTNRFAEAQAIIFEELESVTDGAAKAARNTLGGALRALDNAWGDLFEVSQESSQGIVDAINNIALALPKVRDAANIAFLTLDVWMAEFVKSWSKVDYVLGLIKLRLTQLNQATSLTPEKFTESIANQRKELAGTLAVLQGIDTVIEERLLALGKGLAGGERPAAGPAPKPRTPTGTAAGAEVPSADDYKKAMDAFNAQYFADSEKAFNQRMQLLEDEEKEYKDALDKMLAQHATDSAAAFAYQMDEQARLMNESIRNTLGAGIASSIEDAFTSGIAAAISSGRIADAWKAMGQSIIQNIASAMVQVALKAINFAKMLAAIQKFMVANPIAAVVAATALLAFAYANGGQASSGGVSMTGGAGGLQYSAMGSMASNPVQQIIFGATSATTAAGMQPRQAMNVTIIGPNDPQAQRSIQELMNKANSRGRVG